MTSAEVGLSKDTIAEIVKRSRSAQLALMLLCFAGTATCAHASSVQPPSRMNQAGTDLVQQDCNSIANLANSGALALRAADLVGHGVPIDLGNDGHPEKIIRLDDQGTAHQPYLANEAHHPIDFPPWAYWDHARWARDVSVLKVGQRFWRVDWNPGRLDSSAALIGATDGRGMCRFHTSWRAPVLKLLSGAKSRQADTFWALLIGKGVLPLTAGLDPAAVQAASDLHGTPFSIEAPSWIVDLRNDRHPMTLVRLTYSSGAGSGCDFSILGQVREGRVTLAGSQPAWLADYAPISPATPDLKKQLGFVMCYSVTATPLLDQQHQAYVLFDNVARNPNTDQRVKLLASVRNGKMWPLARLSWKAWNQLESTATNAAGEP